MCNEIPIYSNDIFVFVLRDAYSIVLYHASHGLPRYGCNVQFLTLSLTVVAAAVFFQWSNSQFGKTSVFIDKPKMVMFAMVSAMHIGVSHYTKASSVTERKS